MGEYMMFWFSKALVELMVVIGAIMLIIAIFLAYAFYKFWQQKRCLHPANRVIEVRANAICFDCDKNLGFIGTWREQQKDK